MKNVEKNHSSDLTRRNFIHSAALAGAGLTLATSAATGQSKKPETVNFALVGAGQQGLTLLEACDKIEGVQCVAVCDIWEAFSLKRVSGRLSKAGVKHNAYTDYREMLEKEKNLDAVIVATPDFWHAPQTLAALGAGRHVYCEKAMSNTIEGARSMVAAARKTKKLLQIGHQRRSNPKYRHCAEGLLGDVQILGRLTAANAQWNRAVQTPQGWPRNAALDAATLERWGFKSMAEFRNWRWYQGLGGGPIMDLGTHQIDILNWFLGGPPKAVLASGTSGYYDPKTHQWPETVMAVFDYASPESGTIQAFYQTVGTNSSQGYFENIMGDRGTLIVSESASRGAVYREPAVADDWKKWVDLEYLEPPPAPKIEEGDEKPGVALDVRETIPVTQYKLPASLHGPYHQPHLQNFFNAVRGEEDLNCPAEIAYETVVTALKVNDAIAAGKKLAYKPEEFRV